MARGTLDMRREEDRLLTYTNWIYNDIQNPRELAKAALYFTGIADRVECPFCLGVLKKWLRSDIPYREHSTHFPYCRFIRGYDVGNVPMYGSPSANSVRGYSNYIANSNNNGIPSHDVPCSNPDVFINRPTSPPPVNSPSQWSSENVPDLKTEVNRLATFATWPTHLPQTPEILSRAGFYHLPTDEKPDRVQCAYCKGKLFNWQKDDDPFIEHARCFPDCRYIELCMGAEVVRELRGNCETPTENTRSENSETIVPIQPTGTTPPSTSEAERQTEDTVAARMESEPVRAVLEMGFADELVKQTVERCLQDRPENFPPAEELASMVMELEDQQVHTTAAAPLPTPLQRMMTSRQGSDVTRSNQSGTPRTVNHTVYGRRQVDPEKIRSENSRMKDQLLCKICMENLVRVTFMPCGHLVCCGPCSMTMSECPICRANISGCVRTYF